MRVAVTGATGFVGQHVCSALEASGHEVVTAPRNDLRQIVAGVHPSVGAVVHLAAYCGGIGKNRANPARMLADNARMALNTVEACALSNTHVVCLGSVCAYPEHTPVPFREDHLWQGHPEPTNAPYGIAKRLLLEACRAFCGPYTYLLPANMYGPGDHFDLEDGHVVPTLIRKFIDGDGRLWGDGTPTRDFLYVEDCARAIVAAVERGPHPEPINVGTGVETSISDLAAAIAEATGFTGEIEWDASMPNGQLRRCLDTARARHVLGWRATTPLADGLRKTVEWYRCAR